MHPTDEELRKAVALFRYGLIADVLRVPPGSRETRRALHEKAQRTYVIPGTRRTRVAVETMRDWLRGKNRTLLPHPSRRLARPPHPRGHRQPRHTEPHPVGLGRGRVPPIPPSRTRRAHPARPVGPRRAQRALPRPSPRPRRPLPLRGQTPRHERPHREPARTALRGRRRARRRNRHLALRPTRSACAPHRGRPPRQARRTRHPPRRLRQHQASLRSKRNFPVKRHRPSSQLHCDTPAREPNPSPLAMRHLKENN